MFYNLIRRYNFRKIVAFHNARKINRGEMKTKLEKQNKEIGASLVEYGLLVALIAVICIAAIRLLGTNVSTNFSQIASGVGST